MQKLFALLKLSFNRFYENFRMAANILLTNKLRSFLTITGVIIGVITVMLISSVISGIDLAFKQEVESFGTRTINLHKFEMGFSARPGREERMRKPLTTEDSEALAGLSSVEAAIPFLSVSAIVGKSRMTDTSGKPANFVGIRGTSSAVEKSTTDVLVAGRWFTKNENETRTDVCVIGNTVKDNYFPFTDPLGETLEIGGREFRVIGILQKRPQLFGDAGDFASSIVYIPMGSAERLQPDVRDLYIQVIAHEGMFDKAQDDVQDLLRLRRNVPLNEPNNFAMSTAESLIKQFHEITAGVALAMIAISSIGLLIGGIGVMNIMLVSVTERTHEIGLRKAIGARRKDILLQFLIEAATLTGCGGVLGLLTGWLLTFIVKLFMPSYVPLWAPILGLGVSIGIGIVFGLFPAWKAARLDPIEALRYE